ncbi:MAG: hypothetical protein IJK52_00935 [Oscillospiraceae bacterium]|nr:hypothetical protein [Oscillospiraceae bacterium]
MDGVKRKLADRQGLTLVVALVTLLILTMFSADLTLASLYALRDSVLLRDSEKAYASVNSAARFILNSLKAAPDGADMAFIVSGGKWRSDFENDNAIVQKILLKALNNDSAERIELIWRVKSDGWPEMESAFTDIPLTVTAECCADENLADFVGDRSPCKPTVTIRFCHPDYQMTMRIAACSVAESAEGYLVKFAENGEMDVALSLGAS